MMMMMMMMMMCIFCLYVYAVGCWSKSTFEMDGICRFSIRYAGLPLSFYSWAYVRQGVYFLAYGTPGVSIFGLRQAFQFYRAAWNADAV